MVSEFVVVVAFQLLIVTFQGSVTVKDWAADMKAILTRIENPLTRVEGRAFTVPQSKKIGVHSGFHSYLLGHKSKNR